MQKSPLEQRVAMIQNIREISSNNERTMSSINSIVNNTRPATFNLGKSKNKLKFRFLVAVLLFGIYMFFDFEKVEFMGYSANDVEKMIEYSLNYDEIIKQANTQLTNVMNIE